MGLFIYDTTCPITLIFLRFFTAFVDIMGTPPPPATPEDSDEEEYSEIDGTQKDPDYDAAAEPPPDSEDDSSVILNSLIYPPRKRGRKTV